MHQKHNVVTCSSTTKLDVYLVNLNCSYTRLILGRVVPDQIDITFGKLNFDQVNLARPVLYTFVDEDTLSIICILLRRI